jgi:RND family efflux transporter MFP subunit
VRVAEAQADAAGHQVGFADAGRRAMGEQVRVAEAQIAASRQQVAGSRSALATAADMAGYTRITAPFDGVVTERLADPGAFVQNAGGNQAAARGVVKVVRDRTLRVMIPVPETDIPLIRKDQNAVVTVDAYPKESFPGRVSRFATAVDPKSRTMLTEVDLPNPGGRLRPGMYARVILSLQTHRSALSVPSDAVMGKDEDRFVYTVSGGKAHKTPVKIGVDDGKMAEITEGLQPDSQVVLVGRDTLVDGAAVKTEPAKIEPAKR